MWVRAQIPHSEKGSPLIRGRCGVGAAPSSNEKPLSVIPGPILLAETKLSLIVPGVMV